MKLDLKVYPPESNHFLLLRTHIASAGLWRRGQSSSTDRRCNGKTESLSPMSLCTGNISQPAKVLRFICPVLHRRPAL